MHEYQTNSTVVEFFQFQTANRDDCSISPLHKNRRGISQESKEEMKITLGRAGGLLHSLLSIIQLFLYRKESLRQTVSILGTYSILILLR